MAATAHITQERIERVLRDALEVLNKDFGVDTANNLTADAKAIDKWRFVIDHVSTVMQSGKPASHAGVYSVLNSLLATTCNIAARASDSSAGDNQQQNQSLPPHQQPNPNVEQYPVRDVEQCIEHLCDILSQDASKELDGVSAGGDKEQPVQLSSNAFDQWRMKILTSLYAGMERYPSWRVYPFCALLKLSENRVSQQMSRVPTDAWKVRSVISKWKLNVQLRRRVWQQLYEFSMHSRPQQQLNASRCLMEILRTYDRYDAQDQEAVSQINTCLQQLLASPKMYLYDVVMSIPLIDTMPQDNIYKNLLQLLVDGTLDQLEEWLKRRNDELDKIGLSLDTVMQKLRIMTLLRACQNQTQVTFGRLEKDLHLPAEQVQNVIVEALQHRLIIGKVDERQGILRVMSSETPVFKQQHWDELERDLESWQAQIRQLSRLLNTLVK